MPSDSGDKGQFLTNACEERWKTGTFLHCNGISLTCIAYFPKSDVMHTEFHSMIIQDLRNESAEREKKVNTI